MLITAGWVVVGSCDSLTYGNNDGVNRITAANKFVFGYGGGAVKSWIILKNPALGSNVHLLFWGENYGAAAGSYSMRCSLTGFGTAYGGTDGTLTAAPLGATFYAGTYTSAILLSTSSGSHKGYPSHQILAANRSKT